MRKISSDKLLIFHFYLASIFLDRLLGKSEVFDPSILKNNHILIPTTAALANSN